jgi:hypothetical protein
VENLRSIKDPVEARFVWETLMPRDVITDLWEVRSCFHRHFRRPIHFIAGEKKGRLAGLLPLSWVEESGVYSFFPGETWHGKTWLEQNFIVGEEPSLLLDAVPGPFHLRYLSQRCSFADDKEKAVDEIGYIFRPSLYGYQFNAYLERFSGKARKKIRREIRGIKEQGLTWRYDRLEDIDVMIAMNLSRFGPDSYFSDPRFRKGFMEMIRFFAEQGWLRITTALIRGAAAAVDAGVLYKGTYTLMAGGTDPCCPGIAKVINMRHIERACEEGMQEVDFLCGDFNWKKIFHLHERPLFLASRAALRAA